MSVFETGVWDEVRIVDSCDENVKKFVFSVEGKLTEIDPPVTNLILVARKPESS